MKKWLLVVMLGVLLSGPVALGKVSRRVVECGGQKYGYVLFAPKTGVGELPAILLLHGAGDSPEPMVEAWRSLAEREGIVLVAPELPRKREFEAVAPDVFRCVVEDAKTVVRPDTKRLYVFGNSMGGYLAYDAAAFLSEYFAAVGVHAMGIDPEYDGILDKAKRKTPIIIYMGERDPLVSVKNVRRTKELLERKGFPVKYEEILDHDHNYYEVSKRVNAGVWEYFVAHAMQ